MNVLVTDGENRAALAVVRSLGRSGHRLVVASRINPALAQTSRFCAARVRCPDPFKDASGYVDALTRTVAEFDIDVILPVTDVSTLLVTEHRGRFEPNCRVPFAPVEVIARAADKVDVIDTARRLSIPVPKTVTVPTPDTAVPLDVTYPVVVKPHRSRHRVNGGWLSSTVTYADSPQQLAAEIAARADVEFPLALQEKIPGPGLGIFMCYDRGALVGLFCHRRLREKPPSGGVSVLCESVSMCPEAREYADRLLRELGWQGVAMVEFKRDERDGVPKLMEINGRFWGSLQLAIDAGVDFPNILLNTLRSDAPQAPQPYRSGVRSRWFWGDVDSLLIQLFTRGHGRGRAPSLGRLHAVTDFLHLWGSDLRYENPRSDDLRPFFHETAAWFSGAL
jgi:predicted ATP-grasp superfamily ATP-dependent carboligase